MEARTVYPGKYRGSAAALAAWVNAAGIFDASKLPDPFPPVLCADGKSLDPEALLPDLIAALNATGIQAKVTIAGAIELVY
jgi:hypothetical protein